VTLIVMLLLRRTHNYVHGDFECLVLLLRQALNLAPDTVGIRVRGAGFGHGGSKKVVCRAS
jgi:hypothetical protein